MTSLPVAEPVVKLHLSLNVADLARSIDFYRVLFGIGPAKRHDDYAKFELEDPPVVFSLVPRAPGPGGSLSHLGFRVAGPEEVRRARERLAAAGLCTQDQNGTVCGYARQDKVWTRDPDGNFWEVYAIEEDVEPVLVRRSLEGPAARIFNAALDETARTFVVREALRVLKPGGKVVAHGLMGDRPLPGTQPRLPGLAAMVSRVPARDEVVSSLLEAGLVQVQAVKLTEKPWFVHDGVGLREVKLVAWKPSRCPDGETRQVLYKGPFAQATADGGWVFRRGQRVTVPASVWHDLRRGPAAGQFLFFEPGAGSCSGV
jgi:catechol 2,3-dioxygenase-like lactoylglutathione lyase family enzyme